jgi:cysteinyl-tRNA synthetase
MKNLLKLYNTLTRKVEEFKPIKDDTVGMYTCGPTVYNYVHIGNLRTYVFEDILHRVLEYNGYHVNHIMNITDVGHLTDDADHGQDKMEAGSKREGKTAYEIAEFYTKAFISNMRVLNLKQPNTWCKATDHIDEQIKQVQILINKGYTYETTDGIYFDTTKLKDYGKLAQLDKQILKPGARVDMGEKNNPRDFALWKFSMPDEERQMEWDAFGKKGFPGWHIECSTMSMEYLGNQFDIHCGGIDHVPVHHTNEIAQAETSTAKKPWVKFWLHGEFLLINKDRMGKSEGNFITLQYLLDKGYSPLDYRYFLLQTHYRKQLNFSWDALTAAQTALQNLRDHTQRIQINTKSDPKLEEKFLDAINEDLNIPQALALIWDSIKSEKISLESLQKFDEILGLDLAIEKPKIPTKVQELIKQRQEAREEKQWNQSDQLRDEIKNLGYLVEDSDAGQKLIKNN